MIYDYLIAPFDQYFFMRRALVACIAIAFGCAPIGVILVVRRMSLVGDAMSHAILPGAALGFFIAGTSVLAMTIGGITAALIVAFLSTVVTRSTEIKEDASFASFYLISLAIGVVLVSTKGSNVDLMHILFGTILSVDNESLILIASISSLTILLMAVIYRPLIIECLDPGFLKAKNSSGGIYHHIFIILVVLNLVSGFRALGTLMAVGMIMLPVTTAKFWSNSIGYMTAIAIAVGAFSGYVGLLVSYYLDIPSGPSIIISAGLFYLLSIFFGKNNGIVRKIIKTKHLEA